MTKHIPYFPNDITKYPPWVAKYGLTAPYGECQCGCGQLAPLAISGQKRYGYVPGAPTRFVGFHRTSPSPRPILERLWKKTTIVNECWLWQGCTNGHYGTIGYEGKSVYVHRISYELHFGSIPDGMNVNHNCPDGDNALCWNPAHLWLGTQLQNIADTVKKGRVPRGIDNHHAKLTEDDVREIRKLRAQGMKLDAIAELYNITFSNVGMIARGDTWQHVE